jgi:TPR repeat protein
MRRTHLKGSLLPAVMLAGWSLLPATFAGFDEGLAAYRDGDHATALSEFEPSADSGHAQAQFYLGFMYEKGQGVPVDAALAASWYQKAADQGVAGAQFNLGLAMEQGRGVGADPAAALIWIRKAADQGNLRAQYKAAEMYESGSGTEADLVRAHLWFNLAGKMRHRDAKKRRKRVAKKMTPYEIAEAEMLSRHWKQAQRE